MWKKFLVVLFSLVGTFSVIYAMNRDIEAASEPLLKVGDVFDLGKAVQYKGGMKLVVSWKIVDVKDNIATALANDEDFYVTRWAQTCFSNQCLTYGYSQGIGEAYEYMHGGGLTYLQGLGFKRDYKENGLAGVNAFVMGAKNFFFEDGFVSEPYIMSLDEYMSIPNKTIMYSSTTSAYYGWWLSTPANARQVHSCQGTYGDANGLALANGYIADSLAIRPSIKFDLSKLSLKVIDLSLNYTPTPQNSLLNYEYNENVIPGDKIGEIAYQDGAGTPTLSILADPNAPSGHENDYKNFELTSALTTSPVDVNIKSTGAPDLVNGSLKAGDYYFRVSGVDEKGNPSPAPFQDVKLTVDKTTATLTFNDTTTKNMKIGDATFTDSMITSNTDTLVDGDMAYSLSGGVTGALTVAPNDANPSSYNLKVPATFGSGLPTDFTLSATLGETDNFKLVTTTTNRTINVTKGIGTLAFTAKKSSFLPSEVSAANTTIGSIKVADGIGPFTYELVSSGDPNYNPTTGSDNTSFTVSNTPTALGSAVDVKTSSVLTTLKTYNLQFKVTDTNTSETAYASGSIVVGLNAQADLKFKDAPGGIDITTTGQKIVFDDTSAKLLAEGGSSGIAIEYTALPQAQQPSNVDPDTIATINKTSGVITPVKVGTIKVKAKRPGNASYSDIETTMNLTIEPAEQDLVFNNATSSVKVPIGTTIREDAKATLKSSGLAGVGTITYVSSDPTIASVDANGNVTGVKAGNVTLTATLNDKSKAGYNSNYEEVIITKAIQVYRGMNVTWAASTPNIKAENNAILDKVGMISVSDNQGVPTYNISTNTTASNADASFFQIIGSGTTADLKLAKKISVTDWVSHSGVFKVQVDITDSNATTTIDIVVNVDEADNDLYFTDNGVKVTALSKVFGENANTFQLTSLSTNAGSVTYDVAPSDTSGILSVTSTGVVTINKAGTAVVQAVVASGGGYASKIITMNVTITKGQQSIVFQDTATLTRPFVVNSTFNEFADLKETSLLSTSARKISYVSNSPTICSIDTTGVVTMLSKGTCDIDAKNTDADWQNASVNKRIMLFDKIGVSWTDVTPLLKAEATAIGDKVGTINVVNNQGVPTYAISSNTGSQNADKAFFKIVGSGSSVTLNLNKQISASDWMSHGGTFKVQVDVSDANGMETIDISVQVNEADNVVSFTDGVSNISSLSKKFGETGNTFTLMSTSTNAGSATYSVDASDTSGTLSVTGNGIVTIHKTGTATVQVLIGAGSGYAQNTATMDVHVIAGDQNITFQDTITISRVFVVNSTFNELADLKETSLNTPSARAITYVSNSPAICSIDVTGTVTMLSKGTCDIDAKNMDSDWNAASVNKRIVLYDKMNVGWTPSTPKLKAEATTVGDMAGTLAVSDNQGVPTYAISTNTSSQNADASFFKVTGNGASADVKLNKQISAADWLSHNGVFKVQVDVIDNNGTETIDIIVNVDAADNYVSFSDNGSAISSLTKKYGENGNAFSLTSISTNAGVATYSIDASDTSGTLTLTPTGGVNINKVGTAVVKVDVGAGSGYVGNSATMNVKVDPGDQVIAFNDTSTINRQFVLNATYSEGASLQETSLNTNSRRSITYTSNTPTVCDIDVAGTVTMLAKGLCDVDATNNDANWTSVTTNKVINFYDGMGVSIIQTPSLQAENTSTNVGAKAGSLSVTGGMDPKTYAISSDTGAKNKDASFFQVNLNGIITFKKGVSASDLVGKYNSIKKVYELRVQIETTDSVNTKVVSDGIIAIKGAELKAEFDTKGTGKISEAYGDGKKFALDLSSNKGNGVPTYQLKNDPTMPSDVLQSVDASGLVTILHANDKSFVGNPLKVEAIIPASQGYDEETIEVEVEITKAPQPSFVFKTPNIKLGYSALMTPTFQGKLSTGTIVMTSADPTIASIVGNDIQAGTSDGVVVITAFDSGDRDYKSSIPATATVTISSEPAYNFTINVPSATYGDSGLSASIGFNEATGANQVQTWSSSDPSIADIDNTKAITIKKAGTVTITCTQTSTGEPSVSATAMFIVKPKPITITINNKSKYVGESVPAFDMTIPSGVLVGSDTISLPTFSCVDTLGAPVTNTTLVGSYPIIGTYPTGANSNYAIAVTPGSLTIKQDTSQASWYHLEGVTSGSTLDTTKWHNEDAKVVLDSAVETAGTYDEISLDKVLWDSTSITVSNEDENNEVVYFRINASGILSSSQSTIIKIDKTNPVIKSITGTPTNKGALSTLINNLTFGTFFKPGTKISIVSDDSALTNKVSGVKDIAYKVYEINQTTGIMNSTTIDSGTLTPDAGGKSEITLDDIGLYRVCAIATDNAGNVGTESCSDVNIKKIDVDIDGDGENEFQDPDNDGCPDINIPLKDDEGAIYKLNVDRDKDGIPDLDIDSDGDGIADINVDTDQDKKPDINLVALTKWTPTFCVTGQIDNEGQSIKYCTMKGIDSIINIDTNQDHIPDINIDSDGDMIADINIDQNKNKELDVHDYNITTKMDVWTPENDFELNLFRYDTQSDLKAYVNTVVKDTDYPSINIDSDGNGLPDLNIDINLDGIPDVEIDGDGDGIADINLDPEGTGTPQDKIFILTSWSPTISFKKGENTYLTMSLKGSNELEDNGVKIEKPSGETFLPNYAFKTEDVTSSISNVEKEKITSVLDEGSEIKQIYSVSLLKDDTSIQPDGMIRVKIPVVKGLKNPKLVIEQKDGTQKMIEAVEVDGYYVYETDYLSMVSIIGDKEIVEPPIEEKPDVTLPSGKPGGSGGSTPGASVKGDYTGNIGGAGTGDTTNVYGYIIIIASALGFMNYIYRKESKRK